MTIIHDPLNEIATQLRIRNALELIRISGQQGWTPTQTDRVAHQLRIDIESIYPEQDNHQ